MQPMRRSLIGNNVKQKVVSRVTNLQDKSRQRNNLTVHKASTEDKGNYFLRICMILTIEDVNKVKLSNAKLNIYKYQKSYYNMSQFDKLFLSCKSSSTRNREAS